MREVWKEKGETMVDCKYILPCGRCEKRGADCDAPNKECNHHWIIEVRKTDLNLNDGYDEHCVVHQYCSLCGGCIARVEPIKDT